MDADTDLFKDNTIHHWRVHSIKSSSHCVVRFGDEFLVHLNDNSMEIHRRRLRDEGRACLFTAFKSFQNVCAPESSLFKGTRSTNIQLKSYAHPTETFSNKKRNFNFKLLEMTDH